MRALRRLAASVLVGVLLHSGAQAAAGDFVAGETGWYSDSAGTALVVLRTTIRSRVRSDGSTGLGTLLVFCLPTEDRMIFNLNSMGAVRSTQPSGSGTAYIQRLRKPATSQGGLSLSTALKVYPDGSFEIQDLPTGERNTARTFVSDIVDGGSRYEVRLNVVSDHARFERERVVRLEVVVTAKDRTALQRFAANCKLLNSGPPS